jgi:hypothetical protein
MVIEFIIYILFIFLLGCACCIVISLRDNIERGDATDERGTMTGG